jgi:hypothetical protein
MEAIKRKVRVVIEKEVEIEITAEYFERLGMTLEEYLTAFRKGLWEVEGIDEVVKYAANVAATNGAGCEWDGLGLVNHANSTYPRIPDVKFSILSEDVETEILHD